MTDTSQDTCSRSSGASVHGRGTKTRRYRFALGLLAAMLLSPPDSDAVPSFSRQTNMPCSMCHTIPPELKSFGRTFKLNGYTLTAIKQIAEKGGPSTAELEINDTFPLSAMFLVSDTYLNTKQPGTQNNDVAFPQQLSLFLSGQWTPHVGSFLQATYTQADNSVGIDNTDIRYANHSKLAGKTIAYGATLNNNPTVEDLWNSTPAWGFPWISSDTAPMPAAAPVIAGPLAQDVAGLGGYAMWDNHLYGDVTVYRSAHLGGPQPPTGQGSLYNIDGVAPYWRFAWQQDWTNTYLMIGTYGIYMKSFPQAISGLTDRYVDPSVDVQFDRSFGVHLLSVYGTFIRENADLNATFAAGGATTSSQHLNTLRLTGVYHYGTRVRAALSVFSANGTRDPLLYPPAPVTGSATGKPDSRAYIAQVGYWPWQNLDLTVQYTAYTKFNGRGTNYDGSGRNASANNTLYLAAWFVF